MRRIWTTDVKSCSRRSLVTTLFRCCHSKPKDPIFGSVTSGNLFRLEKRYAHLLGLFAADRDVSHGRSLHARILRTMPDPDLFLSNCLASMYCKCGSLREARYVFDAIPKRDVVSWNTMINGYCLYGSHSYAFRCLRKMVCCGIKPEEFSFVGVLKGCVGGSDSLSGLQSHCVIIKLGLDGHAFVVNGLVEFYAECHAVGESVKVFDCLDLKDVVLVNTMIGVIGKDGNPKGSFDLFWKHIMSSRWPTRATFVNLLGVLHGHKCLNEGVQLHGLVIKLGYESDDHVESSLVMMYSNCDSVDNGYQLLMCSGSRNVISWTTLINGYSNHGLLVDSIHVFCHIHHHSITPDCIFFVSVLEVLAQSFEYLGLGLQIHSSILKSGFGVGISVQDALMDMYAKCKSLGDALKIFQQIENNRDLFSWTIIISGYVDNGYPVEAVENFRQMIQEGITPDLVACNVILVGCLYLEAKSQAEQIHSFVIKSGYGTSISIQTTLISFYSDIGCFNSVFHLFEMMITHDIVSWTALISGYVKIGYCQEALACFLRMLHDGFKPNNFTFACALAAASALISTETGKVLHGLILKSGLQEDVSIGSALIDMYSKCGYMNDAVSCFIKAPKDDMVMWNALISGHAHHGNVENLMQTFHEMQNHGVEYDRITFLVLLSGLSHGGYVEKAIDFYLLMHKHELIPEVEHVASVVDALGRAGLFTEAVQFIQGADFGCDPVVLRTLLGSCNLHRSLKLGLAIIAKLVILGDHDPAEYVMFSNLCAAGGKWELARKARELMDKTCLTAKLIGQSWI